VVERRPLLGAGSRQGRHGSPAPGRRQIVKRANNNRATPAIRTSGVRNPRAGAAGRSRMRRERATTSRWWHA